MGMTDDCVVLDNPRPDRPISLEEKRRLAKWFYEVIEKQRQQKDETPVETE